MKYLQRLPRPAIAVERKIVPWVFLTTWRTAPSNRDGVRASPCQRLLVGRATRLYAVFINFIHLKYLIKL